jgi:pyridoxine/pyridoxamine 5'-phosphate oxidase
LRHAAGVVPVSSRNSSVKSRAADRVRDVSMVELWQGQPSRLHDRVRYRKTETGWTRDRLAP